MGPLGELGALFNPGMRHEIEERASKANRREEEGNARDGDLRIDLASGVAVINVPGKSGNDAPKAAPSRAAGKEAAPPASEKRAPADRRSAASGRAARTADRTRSAETAATPKGLPGETGKPRTGPVPSSKASRAAR